MVAPLVGAWIEISVEDLEIPFEESLPLWERGLKFLMSQSNLYRYPSLPLWERGLKYLFTSLIAGEGIVAPLVGAWIEIEEMLLWIVAILSLPLWERGLKSVWYTVQNLD